MNSKNKIIYSIVGITLLFIICLTYFFYTDRLLKEDNRKVYDNYIIGSFEYDEYGYERSENDEYKIASVDMDVKEKFYKDIEFLKDNNLNCLVDIDNTTFCLYLNYDANSSAKTISMEYDNKNKIIHLKEHDSLDSAYEGPYIIFKNIENPINRITYDKSKQNNIKITNKKVKYSILNSN